MNFSWERFFTKLSERKFWAALFGAVVALMGLFGLGGQVLDETLGALADALATVMGMVVIIVWQVGEAKADAQKQALDANAAKDAEKKDDAGGSGGGGGAIAGLLLLSLLLGGAYMGGCAGGYSDVERQFFSGLAEDGAKLAAVAIEDATADLAFLDPSSPFYADATRQLERKRQLALRLQARCEALEDTLRGRALTPEEMQDLILKLKEIEHVGSQQPATRPSGGS